MITTADFATWRDLFRLGIQFAKYVRGDGGSRPQPAALVSTKHVLDALGVRVSPESVASDAGREQIRAQIHDAIARTHERGAAPLFSLGWCAAEVRVWADAYDPNQPFSLAPPDENVVRSARRFLDEVEAIRLPARIELAEIEGWCQAVAAGRVHSLVTLDFGAYVDDAFLDGTPRAPPKSAIDEPSTFQTATPAHIVEMVALHHIVCSIAGMRMSSTSLFYGDLGEGMYAYDDEQESHFVMGWNEHGVVGFAFHKYAAGEESDVPEDERNPMRHVPGLPRELADLARELSNQERRWFTSGFYLTQSARWIEPDHEYDGSEHFHVFAGTPRDALFGKGDWAQNRSIRPDQAELARKLAKRAMRGGGDVTDEELDLLLEPSSEIEGHPLSTLTLEGIERTMNEFAKLGLRLNVPTDLDT